ncbi:MAG: hypothetical protein QOJ80_3378 [Mycobacterium sp.]|nr:hypothetical protein [Mycobacterium sp.]
MAGSTGGVFPDLPRMPRLPHLRRHVSVKVVLAEAELVVRAARDAVHQVEHCSRPGQQLAQIRSAVIEHPSSDLRVANFEESCRPL